ncbi:MAG: lasso peptide biosynthesis protein [Chloroflexi bacterium]|nr:lasso peptide biosynthesis protein [Chloroflexota bacterium]
MDTTFQRTDAILQQADRIAEALRREPYSLLTNDCITKSVRFVRACRRCGIKAHVVLTVGRSQACPPLLHRRITMPVVHAWGEVEGVRMEVSRPLGASGMWGIVPRDIQPMWRVRF